MTPIELIEAIRETDPYIKVIFTEGGCYRFHLFLKRFWADAQPVIDVATRDHIGSLIDGVVYDINGIADWQWAIPDEDEIMQAKKWSFADKAFLQLGECPTCDEPLLR